MATRPPVSLPKLSRRSRILLIIASVVVLALLLGARFLETYVDWLWFGEVGARRVFSTIVLTRIVLWWSFFTAATGWARNLPMLMITHFVAFYFMKEKKNV